MFRNWGFLLGEIWGLLLLAALPGLFAGWLIWSRRETSVAVVAAAAAPAPLPGAVALSKPASLEAPRGGKADDLKLFKGVGPVLEQPCHKLGYFHFDQIAAWTEAEIAWVDDNLEGFRGRVTRDEWVVQARDLAAGKRPRPGGEH